MLIQRTDDIVDNTSKEYYSKIYNTIMKHEIIIIIISL